MQKCISQMNEKNFLENTPITSDPSQKNGTPQKKESTGTEKTVIIHGALEKKEKKNVSTVKKNIKQNLNTVTKNFVQTIVNLLQEENLELMTLLENVRSVESNLKEINTCVPSIAVSCVHQNLDEIDYVYNLTVDQEHEYFADGYLVHNCMDSLRYVVYTQFFTKNSNKMTEEDAKRLESQYYSRI